MSAPAYPAYKESGFEWFGDVPAHWTVTRLKYLGEAIIGLTYDPSQVVDGDSGTLVLRSSNVQKGKIILDDNVYVDATIQPDLITRIGDILICSRNGSRALIGKNATIDALSVGRTFGAFMTIFRSRHSRYVSWLLNSPLFEFQSGAFLTSTINQLTVGVLNNLEVPLPPEAERDTIVAFLDRETGKIDALVAEQERLIALLKEKRQAVISHDVTKGLNPNAPMKESGVPWLGEIPAHWEVKRLKQLIAVGTSISYGIVQPGEPQISGVPFVQTTNMTSGQFGFDYLQKTTPEVASNYPRSRLTGGEVLLGIRASIGAAFVAPSHLQGANLSRGVARIAPGSAVLAKYLVEFCRTQNVSDYWGQMRQGSTFNEVSIETVREMWVTVPPKSEQSDLIQALGDRNAKFDDLSAEATRAITLLRERRAALISAAVTGKIDVRDTVVQPSLQAA